MELNPAKISLCHSSLVSCDTIKNIIFDFGGVICNINPDLTKRALTKLGLKKIDPAKAIASPSGLFGEFETGAITPSQFRDRIREYMDKQVTDESLDDAWNALLLDIPEPRIRLLEALRKRYRIFLLSNSNLIHYDCYVERFRQQYGYEDFDALFEKAWFSFRIGIKKPDTGIFNHVLAKGNLLPYETLFIDDTLVHVEGARKTGIIGYHLDLTGGEEMRDLFL